MSTKQEKQPIEGYVCFILLLGITIVMGMEVIARYVFKNSFEWSAELARYLFVWFIFIGASYAITQKSHIKIEALINLLPAKTRPYFELTGNIFWFIFSIFVAYIGFNHSIGLLTSNQLSTVMRIPVGLVYISIPVGYALMAIRLLLHEFKKFKNNLPINT